MKACNNYLLKSVLCEARTRIEKRINRTIKETTSTIETFVLSSMIFMLNMAFNNYLLKSIPC